MGRIVGIDLGTTNSLVAYVDAQTGQPKCIPGPYSSTLCPSVVSLDPDGSIIVGEAARRRRVWVRARSTRIASMARSRSRIRRRISSRETSRARARSSITGASNGKCRIGAGGRGRMLPSSSFMSAPSRQAAPFGLRSNGLTTSSMPE